MDDFHPVDDHLNDVRKGDPDARHVSSDSGNHPAYVQLLETYFVLSRDVALEEKADHSVTIFNKASLARLKLSKAAYSFLSSFETPKRILDVLPSVPGPQALSNIQSLVKKGMLVDAQAPQATKPVRQRTTVAYKMFNAPMFDRSTSSPDFVILGVPYDLGGLQECRAAPALVRQKSLDFEYQLDFSTGSPCGWFDVNRAESVLEGATISDAGDIYIDYGENQSTLIQRIIDGLGHITGPETVPVMLGGSGSITYAGVLAQKARGDLSVVRLSTMTAFETSARSGAIVDAQVGRRIMDLGHVRSFVCATVDDCEMMALAPGGSDNAGQGKEKFSREKFSTDQLTEKLPPDAGLYLSIDMKLFEENDVFAGSDFSVSRPPLLRRLKKIIETLGQQYVIHAIDLVGFDADARQQTVLSVNACHLLLYAMDAAFDKTEASHV